MNDKDREINASPTKDFFIYMITRDIQLEDAILELVDNSIDGAKNLRENERYDGLEIKIKIDETKFSICDNCSGIPIDIAKNYAFRFGRPKEMQNTLGNSTGVFGIGMKRALFKLGNNFEIESKTENSEFLIKFNVDEWKEDDEKWDIFFEKVDGSCTHSKDEIGTSITVKTLYSGISEKFGIQSFISQLKSHIQNHVSLVIEKGLMISINGVPLNFNENSIFSSDDMKPIVKEFETDDVRIKIIAGVGETGKPKDAGWYIYCNGRLLLFADQTEITGWGVDGVRPFHHTFARFRGFVFFESNNLNKLPWNTTKTGVDASASVYISTKNIMINLARPIFDFLKKLKNEGEELEKAEKDIDSQPLVKIQNLSNSNKFNIGSKFEKIVLNPKTTISYTKLQEEVDLLKSKLKVSSNSDVGRKTFEYFLKMECDE